MASELSPGFAAASPADLHTIEGSIPRAGRPSRAAGRARRSASGRRRRAGACSWKIEIAQPRAQHGSSHSRRQAFRMKPMETRRGTLRPERRWIDAVAPAEEIGRLPTAADQENRREVVAKQHSAETAGRRTVCRPGTLHGFGEQGVDHRLGQGETGALGRGERGSPSRSPWSRGRTRAWWLGNGAGAIPYSSARGWPASRRCERLRPPARTRAGRCRCRRR